MKRMEEEYDREQKEKEHEVSHTGVQTPLGAARRASGGTPQRHPRPPPAPLHLACPATCRLAETGACTIALLPRQGLGGFVFTLSVCWAAHPFCLLGCTGARQAVATAGRGAHSQAASKAPEEKGKRMPLTRVRLLGVLCAAEGKAKARVSAGKRCSAPSTALTP